MRTNFNERGKKPGRTTMKRTMTPGPMARAASVEGAHAPTASPSEVDAKDSSVRMPQNLANLRCRGGGMHVRGVAEAMPACMARNIALLRLRAGWVRQVHKALCFFRCGCNRCTSVAAAKG